MRKLLKYFFYQIICPLLLSIGFDKFLRNQSSRRRLIIMYHGISAKRNFSINGRHLPLDDFEKQLKYFIKYFEILSLKELCDRESSKKCRRAIALTFDDGYLNNFQNAIPLLAKYNVPATFFVSTVSLTDKEYLHPPDLVDIIRTKQPAETEKEPHISDHLNKLRDKDAYAYINSLSFEDFKSELEFLKHQYPYENLVTGIDSEVYKLAGAGSFTELISKRLFSIGSHSHDHVNLNMLTTAELRDQLARSKQILEMHTQSPIDTIAFPYGYFNEQVLGECAQQGYQYLFAGGSVDDQWRYHVFPRIGILNMAGYAFNMLSINRGFRRFGF